MSRLIPASVPLLPVTLGFAAGLLCGVAEIGIAIGCIAVAVLALQLWKKKIYPAIIVSSLILGVAEGYLFIPRGANAELEGGEMVMAGTVSDAIETVTGQRLTVIIDRKGASACDMQRCRPTNVSVYIPGFNPEIRQLDRLTFKAVVNPVIARQDIADERNYADFLLRQRIYQQILLSPDSILGVSEGKGWRMMFLQIRYRIEDAVMSSRLNVNSKLLLTALLTGNSRMLPQEDYEQYRKAGIAHILAVSGLHVGIIAFWANLFLWPFMAFRLKNRRRFIVIGVVWLFTFATGLSPSAVRASVFATVLIVGAMLQRKSSPYNSLCLAALIIMVCSPSDLFSVGFQLSFAAVAGILMFARSLNPVPRRYAMVYSAVALITVSVGATLGTAVITMYYFHSFPLFFIIANIVASMILPILFGAVIINGVLSLVGFTPLWLSAVIDRLCSGLYGVSQWLAEIPGSQIDNIYLPVAALIIYVVGLIALKLYVDRGRRLHAVAAVSFAVLFVCFIIGGSNYERSRGVFFLHNLSRTDIIIDDGISSFLTLISTSKADTRNEILENARWRLGDYMGKRGIDSISYIHITPSVIRLPEQRTIVIENGGERTIGDHVDYLVVCRGFRGDIRELANRLQPDTIILSSDISPIRGARFKREVSVPLVDLRQRSFAVRF